MNQLVKYFETHTVLSLTTAKSPFSVEKKPQLPQDLFICKSNNCKLHILYIKPSPNLKTLNNFIYYIKCHITCQNKNDLFSITNYMYIYLHIHPKNCCITCTDEQSHY